MIRILAGMKSPQLHETAPQFKLFKDLIAPALGAVTGMPALSRLPGSAANPYSAPQPVYAPPPVPVYAPPRLVPGGPDIFSAMPGGAQIGMTNAIFPGLGPLLGAGRAAAARVLPSMLGGGAIVGAAGAAVRYGGRIMTAAGKWISRKKVVAVAKQIGIQAASVGLGLGVLEIAEMIVEEETRKKRGSGVTAAQLRTTRKTMRKVMGMARTIRASCSETGFIARRRSSSRAACPAPRVIVTKR